MRAARTAIPLAFLLVIAHPAAAGPTSMPASAPAVAARVVSASSEVLSAARLVAVPANGPYGHSSGWAVGIDQGLKGDGIEFGFDLLAPLSEHWAAHARGYLVLNGATGRPAGEVALEGILRGPVIHGMMRFYGSLGVNIPFLANKLTGSTFVSPAPNNLFFIGGNTGWEFFQDGTTAYFIEIGWWGGYQATRFSIPTKDPSVLLHPEVGNGPLINGGVRFYFH